VPIEKGLGMLYETMWLAVVITVLSSLTASYRRIHRSYQLAHGAPHHDGYYTLGDDQNPPFKLLVLGDSIGSGHGVPDFADAIGSRIAYHLAKTYRVTYVNHAGMGKWIADIMTDQIEGEWDLIALITGSNDLLHGFKPGKFSEDCLVLARLLSQHSAKVIIAGPGAASDVRVFPWWYRLILQRREQKVVAAFSKAAESIDAVYANALEEPRLTKNIGPDKIHLNAKGDDILFDFIWKKVKTRGWFIEQSPTRNVTHWESISADGSDVALERLMSVPCGSTSAIGNG
jgi:lysophospholipase L1-like esterase